MSQPIPRRYIKNALLLLKSLQGELEDSLTEKGFVSSYYLDEKLTDLNREMKIIMSHPTGWVEVEAE